MGIASVRLVINLERFVTTVTEIIVTILKRKREGTVTIESIESEKTSEKGEKLYQALLNHYSQVRDRNDAFTTRAQSLMGFAGIINTILVALMIAIVSDEEVRIILRSSPNLLYFNITIFIGFIGYILSIILALAAFRTTKYMPVPQINSKEFINDVFKSKANLSQRHLAIQVYDAIEYYDKKNAEKYMFLFWATVSLMVAIISTAVLGILIFMII